MEGEMQSDSATVPQIELSSAASKKSSASLFGDRNCESRNVTTCDVKSSTSSGVRCCAQSIPQCSRSVSVTSDKSYDEVSTCNHGTYIPRYKPRYDETSYYPYISIRSDYQHPAYLNSTYYPVYKEMTIFEKRFQSFKRWPCCRAARPEQLAESGLFFCNSLDRVACFMCGVVIKNWEEADTAMREHKYYSPLCKFVMSNFNFRKE